MYALLFFHVIIFARLLRKILDKSRESWPKGPSFDFTPEGRCLPLYSQWNNGMVEKWNIGYEKRMMA
jgi:hypothetical protein